MPSSTDGVYHSGNTLIDYYGNPLDLTQYNLLGPTGLEGATGQDLFFTSGGTGTVERIIPNGSTASDSSTPTTQFLDIDLAGLLPRTGQIIKFSTTQTTEDSTGAVLGMHMYFLNNNSGGGSQSATIFTAGIGAPIFNLSAAKIKPDKDPTTGSPSGFSPGEQINWIDADFEITKETATIISIKAKIYGYNSDAQQIFGQSRFPQKTWILNSGGSYNALCTIRLAVTPDGYGTSMSARNILRYNAF
jgi:hypothetical protein